MGGLSKSVGIRGAALIQFGTRYANVAVQLVITAVLARILTPDDYGVVAVASVFTAFFTMLSDTGIGIAVVQYRDLTDEDYGALMSFTLVLGVVLMALFCLAAWPISWLYGDGRVLSQCWTTSGALLLGTANMVPNGILLKERRFPAIGARLLVSTAASGAIAVVAALAGLGPFSLAIQATTGAGIVLAWNLVARPVRHLTPHFMGPLRRVFRYSAFQFGFNLVNYFSRNLDNLLLGRFMGTVPLAFYDKAYRLTTYPMSAVSGVISSVIQPYMSEHQDDPSRVFEGWMRVQKLVSLVAATVTATFVCFSGEIVALMFGGQWGASVPLFHALAFSVYVQMMNNTSGAFFQSLGRTDLMFQCGVITTSLTVAGIAGGLAMGEMLWVARLVSAAYILHIVVVTVQLVIRGFGQSPSCMLAFLPEVAVAAVSIILCALVSDVASGALAPTVVIAAKLLVLAACFAVGYRLTGGFDDLRGIIGGSGDEG